MNPIAPRPAHGVPHNNRLGDCAAQVGQTRRRTAHRLEHGLLLHSASRNERGFDYKRIAPGTAIGEDEAEFVACNRTSKSNIATEWLSAYTAERAEYGGGIAFPSRKAARNFYRGEWIIQHRADAYEKVVLGRFGGLDNLARPHTRRFLMMSGQDIFMRWDDGMRKIPSPIADGFLLYEYKPGRPLDGVPTRIYAATLQPTRASSPSTSRAAVKSPVRCWRSPRPRASRAATVRAGAAPSPVGPGHLAPMIVPTTRMHSCKMVTMSP